MYRFELIHYKADLSNVEDRYPYTTNNTTPISTYIPSGSDYVKFNMFVHYDEKATTTTYKQVMSRYNYESKCTNST
jgi:hypothetical protein